jgi:hypothetical protein
MFFRRILHHIKGIPFLGRTHKEDKDQHGCCIQRTDTWHTKRRIGTIWYGWSSQTITSFWFND